MPTRHHQISTPWPLTLLATAILAACGGGGGEPVVVETPLSITGVVADGPLLGATVCYDLNDNAACDAGEPTSALTDADGGYRLEVKAADAGKHEVIALVPATAIDKDTGFAVGAAMTLRSPATGSATAQEVFVSALTTAVADVAKDNGKTIAEATAQVQQALNLPGSPLANFVRSGGSAEAALAARALTGVIVDTTRLAAQGGVAADKVAALVKQTVASGLQHLGAALAANPQATAATRVAEAVAAVKAEGNLNAGTVAAIANVLAQPTGTPDAPGPFISVRRFAYTDAGNYSYTLFTGDSSQLDGSGEFTAHEVRKNVVNTQDVPFNRNQAYWSGSAWETCALQWQVISRVKAATATTPQTSTYCPSSRNESKIVTETIAGKTLREVVTMIRAHPLADSVGAHTNELGLPVKWGASPDLLPAAAVFPAGSKLSMRSTRGDIGGTERIELQNKSTVRWPDGKYRQATTLEQYSGMPGNLVDAAATPANANTVFVTDLPLAEQLDTTLEAFKRYRAGFNVASLSVRFYKCDVRKTDQAALNCVTASDGTLGISAQGDARVMRVASGYPAELVQRQRGLRMWVERSGTVFRGMRDLETTRSDVRLNGPAWDALRTALGIEAHVPAVAPANSGPFGTLRNASYTDPNNFSVRTFEGDSSALLPNSTYYVANEKRDQVSGGFVQTFARNQLMWTGSEWYDCPSDGVGVNLINSVAPFDGIYCKGYVDERAHRTTLTLAGRKMSDVINDIRAYGSKDGAFDYGNWGVSPSSGTVIDAATGLTVATALGSNVFPEGSTMEYRGSRRTATPINLFTDAGSQVRVAPADATVAFSTWPFATTLDEFVGKYPGDWQGAALNGANTMHVYQYFLDAAPSATMTTRVDYRVAFNPATGAARFYTANRLVAGDKPTNFVAVLDTTYTVAVTGGKKVLKFAAMPAGFVGRGFFERMYAEHNGSVWYAGKDHVPASELMWSIRINKPAYDALGVALRATGN